MHRYPIWHIKHEGSYESIPDIYLSNRNLTSHQIDNSADHLHDPALMHDMEKGVSRIEKAIRSGERITVFGDYDVDGVTSTAVLLDFLDTVSANAQPLLPDRYKDGYGMKAATVERAIGDGAKLIITADNGISAFDAIEKAQGVGVDVVVIDHHHPQDKLPVAHAVINPNRPDCEYPFKGLAAVGVCFKVVQALSERFMEGNDRRTYLNGILDFVALGTVADMAPMMGENRILTRRGMQVLEKSTRPGIRALKAISGTKGKVDSTSIGFFLGPRINSAGRIGQADLALNLLRADNPTDATRLAEELNNLNLQRQDLQNLGIEDAERQVIENRLADHRMVLVKGDDWHLGVIGLIAGRLKERYNQPVIALSGAKGDTLVASARSAGGYNIVEGIFRASSHLTEYGGHADAAGFSLKPENFDAFRDQIMADANDHLSDADLTPKLDLDLTLRPEDISFKTVEDLEAFAPFGPQNEPPKFAAVQCRLDKIDTVGQDAAHLKMQIQTGKTRCEAIWWREGELIYELNQGDIVDLAFTLESREWRGKTSLQMVLKDMRPTAYN
jgi:single-stranded-DNA-specific exonuclease